MLRALSCIAYTLELYVFAAATMLVAASFSDSASITLASRSLDAIATFAIASCRSSGILTSLISTDITFTPHGVTLWSINVLTLEAISFLPTIIWLRLTFPMTSLSAVCAASETDWSTSLTCNAVFSGFSILVNIMASTSTPTLSCVSVFSAEKTVEKVLRSNLYGMLCMSGIMKKRPGPYVPLYFPSVSIGARFHS